MVRPLYLSRGRNYVAVANPVQVPLVARKGYIATPNELEAAKTDPRVRGALEAQAQIMGKTPSDYRVGASKKLLLGMKLEEFKKGRYTAYFIYNWRPSAEAWREEIIDIVGEPEGEKDKNEEE